MGIDAVQAVPAQMGTRKIEAVTIGMDRATFNDQFENGPHRPPPGQCRAGAVRAAVPGCKALMLGRIGIADEPDGHYVGPMPRRSRKRAIVR